jgi:hypothetical protein
MLGDVTDSYAYNGQGEVAAYAASYQSTVLLTNNYTRDALGRITSKNETVLGSTHVFGYSYDVRGRDNRHL